MATTLLADVQDQVQTEWSALFMQEFLESHLLAALVNKDYEGDIRKKNDTVRVSQIVSPTDTALRTVGVDADTFESRKLETAYVDVVANKRAVESYEFEELIDLQTILDTNDPKIRQSMMFSIGKQINDYLYSLVAPSASAPDHTLTSVANLNSTNMLSVRTLASQSKWPAQERWLLADPQYYSDIVADQSYSETDFAGSDIPGMTGRVGARRYGFNVLEDDSRPAQEALAFHPDWLLLAMQTEPRFQVSNLHSNKQFGYVLSVDLVFGAALGINGDVKHITVRP
jgi:hypothetical protein